MEVMMEKGTYGYLNQKKTRQAIFTVLLFAAAFAVFFIGYFLNSKEKNNVFSIAAVLLILPAAKSLVSLIVVLPYKTIEKFKFEEILSIQNSDMTVLTDLVITSTEKVMNLDLIVITNGNIIGLMGKQNQDISYINTYLTRSIKNQGNHYHVKVFKDYKQFYERVTTLSRIETKKESDEEVRKFILTLAV